MRKRVSVIVVSQLRVQQWLLARLVEVEEAGEVLCITPFATEDISNFVAEGIRDNTFFRITELVEGSEYYRNDLR